MNTYIDVRPDARLKGFRILRKRDVAQRWMENVPLCGLGVLQCHYINQPLPVDSAFQLWLLCCRVPFRPRYATVIWVE